MAKPWAKIEVGYLDHPKFLKLNANAICLWHEGKNYCDKHHTDGLIPKDALKGFRFRGAKSVTQLLASCGPKGDGTAYAPLWESHGVGYKMHDYLDHNDCREAILARIEDAADATTLRKIANAKRQAQYRATRKAELEALQLGVQKALRVSDVTPTCSTPTETETETETRKKKDKSTPAPRALLQTWNHAIISLPKCEAETEDRLRAAKARLQERPDLAWWVEMIAKAEASDFLTGRKPSLGHENWRADIDWILKPGKAAKVMEGKYNNRGSPAQAPSWAQRRALREQTQGNTRRLIHEPGTV